MKKYTKISQNRNLLFKHYLVARYVKTIPELQEYSTFMLTIICTDDSSDASAVNFYFDFNISTDTCNFFEFIELSLK